MRSGTTIRRLAAAALGLGLALTIAVAPVPAGAPAGTSVAFAAPQGKEKNGQDTSGNNVDPVTGTEVKKTSVIQYVNAVYIWLAFIGGLMAVISLMYAGYSYMASYGDPEKIANAKDIVEKTLIGLSLLILAALILNTINPRTVSEPCKKNAPGCGDIDFSKPGG